MRVWRILPARHTSRIVTVVADDGAGGASFVDEMVAGFLKRYRHVHTFRADGDATLMHDDINWASRGPLVLADRTLVRRTLLTLLRQRNAEIRQRVS